MPKLHHHWNHSDDEDDDDDDVEFDAPGVCCSVFTGSLTESRHYSNMTQNDDINEDDDSEEDMDKESDDLDNNRLGHAARNMSGGDYMAEMRDLNDLLFYWYSGTIHINRLG